jgi:hypothetical protein
MAEKSSDRTGVSRRQEAAHGIDRLPANLTGIAASLERIAHSLESSKAIEDVRLWLMSIDDAIRKLGAGKPPASSDKLH